MATPPSADLVGTSFVTQYYNVLHQSPSVVHRFYTDESKVTRDFGSGTVETLTTQEEIHEKFMSMDFSDYKAEIKSVDAQNSLSGGVILMVTGILTSKPTGGRNFVQTFFLAPQEKGYFVLNDAFRYIDVSNHPYAMANGVAESMVSSLPEADEHLAEMLAADDGYLMPDNEETLDDLLLEPQLVDEPVVEAIPDEAPAAQAEEVQAEPTKKSYASIVSQLKAGGGAFLPKAAPPKAPASQSNPAPPAPVPSHDTAEEAPSDGEGDKRSVYAKHLPVNISEQQMEAEFSKFGPLKPGGIHIRTQKQQNGCYAFVEFEDPQSAANAIEASGFLIAGRAIHVEEKKPLPGGPRRFPERTGGGGGRGRSYYGGGGGGGGGRGGYGGDRDRDRERDRESGSSRAGFSEQQRESGRGFGRRTEIREEGGFRRLENQRSQRRGAGGGNRTDRNVE